jgi:hypothetical protein
MYRQRCIHYCQTVFSSFLIVLIVNLCCFLSGYGGGVGGKKPGMGIPGGGGITAPDGGKTSTQRGGIQPAGRP